MSSIAFKMKLKFGFRDEYKKRHDEIWPEMVQLLTRAGIIDYHIFLDPETHILFAVHNAGYSTEFLNNQDVLKRWWEYMADIMEVNDDNSPVIIHLDEVFQFSLKM